MARAAVSLTRGGGGTDPKKEQEIWCRVFWWVHVASFCCELAVIIATLVKLCNDVAQPDGGALSAVALRCGACQHAHRAPHFDSTPPFSPGKHAHCWLNTPGNAVNVLGDCVGVPMAPQHPFCSGAVSCKSFRTETARQAQRGVVHDKPLCVDFGHSRRDGSQVMPRMHLPVNPLSAWASPMPRPALAHFTPAKTHAHHASVP